ncbi:tandem-95 repeat protein [Marinoscillum furvescens]|uniref:Gliding motility-associated-like protein n=1 Tax=Marinoscillum furvescens DSM 4134 TaxID=1122208 RepID=A0A3D9L3E6_MARFU|nr:tandem-95 repeat protein [Marinoscillum furvescens]RED99763.1 gliding motility-associated-like protein [Marinoscillum furvescens DSM 4134]
MKKTIQTVLFFIVCLSSQQVLAQLDTRHYIPPMYARVDQATGGSEDIYLVLTTPKTTAFTVQVMNGAQDTLASILLSRSSPQILSTADLGMSKGNASNYLVPTSALGVKQTTEGLILRANKAFFASVRVNEGAQAGSLTAKGTAGLGKDFRSGHIWNNENTSNINKKTHFISVMATEDNTNVSFSDFGSVDFEVVNESTGSVDFVLHEGESVVLAANPQSLGGGLFKNLNDVNGTRITADKDIAVNTGSWLAGSPTNNGAGRDIGIDQIAPVEKIGEEYILIKGDGNSNENVIVVATVDNTDLYINGGATPVATGLNAGDYHRLTATDYSTNDNMYINATQPVYVYQGLNATDNGGNTNSERQLGLNFLPPIICLGGKEVDIPSIDQLGLPFIQIIAEAGETLTVNGTDETANAKSVSGKPGYETYKIGGYTGNVTISSSRPIRAALTIFSGDKGFGGFFSGFTTEPVIETPDGYNSETCIPDNLPVTLTAEGFDSYQWYRDGIRLDGETSASISVDAPGDYTATGSISACAESEHSYPLNIKLCPGEIAIAKDTVAVTNLGNGTYDVEFELTVENFNSSQSATNLQILEKIEDGLPAGASATLKTAPTITSGTFSNGGLESGFNGKTDVIMLDTTGVGTELAAATLVKIRFTVNVDMNSATTDGYENQAQVSNMLNGDNDGVTGPFNNQDFSDFGSNPDPDGDGDGTESGENDPTFVCLINSTISYDFDKICTDGADMSPTITGLSGGEFSADYGMVVDASTGVVDASESIPGGTYNVYYSFGGKCENSFAITVENNPLNTASLAAIPATCEDDGASVTIENLEANETYDISYDINGGATQAASAVTANASGALTFTTIALSNSDNGVTLNVTLIDDNNSSCTFSSTLSGTLTVEPKPNTSSLTVSSGNICLGDDATATISGSLANGSYQFTYDLSGANTASAQTTSVTLSNGNGTGSFSIPAAQLTTRGSTTVEITKVAYTTGESCESTGLSVTGTFLVKDQPAAADDNPTDVSEDVTKSMNVLSNDSDPDSDNMEILSAGTDGGDGASANGGVVAINNNGTPADVTDDFIEYTSATNYSGADTFKYVISDGECANDTATVSFTVAAVNDAPTAADTTLTTNEDTDRTYAAADFNDNYTDVESQAFAGIRITTLPSDGVLLYNGDTLKAADISPSGFAIASADIGKLVFSPAPDAFGDLYTTYNFQVYDGSDYSSDYVMTMDVVAVNDAPTASNETITTDEDTNKTFATTDFSVNYNDVEGTAMAGIRITSLPAATAGYLVYNGDTLTSTDLGATGFAIATADISKLVFAPAENANGSGLGNFGFEVSDGTAYSSAYTMTLDVTAVNDVPVAANDTNDVDEDNTLTVNATNGVLSNDSDVEGTALSVSQFVVGSTTYTAGQTASLTEGDLTINADGSYEFVPASNFNGSVPQVTYTVTDGTDSSTGTLDLTVNAVNDAPTASNETITTDEDTNKTFASTDFSANYNDVEGTAMAGIRITSLPAAAAGYLIYNGDTLTSTDLGATGFAVATADISKLVFVPTENANGSDSFGFEVSDGTAYSTGYTMTVTVTAVNDVPVAANDTNDVDEDNTLTVNAASGVLANDSDVEVSTLSVSQFVVGSTTYTAGQTASLTEGDLTINADGSYEFVPATNYNGAVPQATYTVTDGTDSSTGTLDVTVNAVNDAPTAINETITTDEDTNKTFASTDFSANYNDVEGTAMAGIRITSLPAATAGYLVYNGDTLTSTDLGATGFAIATADISKLVFAPAENANGSGLGNFGFEVSDGTAYSSGYTMTLDVTAVNDVPVAANDTNDVDEDNTLTVNAASGVLANDSDVEGTALTVSQFVVGSTTYTAGQTASLTEGDLTINADGSYEFVPAANYNGTVPQATYTVTDGTDSSTGTLDLTVNAVNDAPVAGADSYDVAEDGTLTVAAVSGLLANDTDTEGSTLSITTFTVGGVTYNAGETVTLTEGMLTINADGSFTFEPSENYNGTLPSISYEVSDGTDTSTGSLSLNVTAVNDAPATANDTNTVDEDGTLTVAAASGLLANDSDVDGDAMTITTFTVGGVTYNAGETVTLTEGTLTINADGSYTFEPVADYNGSVPQVTYTVTDGNISATASLDLSVNPVNDPPTAENTSYETKGQLTGDLAPFATDKEGDELTFTVLNRPSRGTLVLNPDGTFSFTPFPGMTGKVIFSYRVCDNGSPSRCTQATVTIAIAEEDSDEDGLFDSEEDQNGDGDPTNDDSDGDGTPNYLDTDCDNDGIPDLEEGGNDTDGDGLPDFLDEDSDGDGIPDAREGTGDTDGDGIPDYKDTDSDGDGIPDSVEGTGDSDGDGIPNYLDPDSDGDGIPDSEEGYGDTDGDGIPDYLDEDSDGDGIPDTDESREDSDGDGIPDFQDEDSDGDGIPDSEEGSGDSDGDGIPDYLDEDSDGDGIPDSDEGSGDSDGDGIPDYLDEDSDGDGIPDADEGNGDSDGDGIPDFLDEDSDGDGIPDSEEGSGDTDGDGIPDYLDQDSDGDGTDDNEESTEADCDGDGIPDYRDAYSCDDLPVDDVFTPNFDGFNDNMVIEGIENFPNNSVRIYNRWGNLVWEATGYDNRDNAFQGLVNSGNTLSNGTALPDGTYFFIVDFGDGAKPLQKGYITIKR